MDTFSKIESKQANIKQPILAPCVVIKQPRWSELVEPMVRVGHINGPSSRLKWAETAMVRHHFDHPFSLRAHTIQAYLFTFYLYTFNA